MYPSYHQYLKSSPQLQNYCSSSYTHLKTVYSNDLSYGTLPRKINSKPKKPSIYFTVNTLHDLKKLYKSNSTFEIENIEDENEEVLSSEDELDKTLENKNDQIEGLEFDMTLENLIYEIDNKKLSQKELKRVERNQSCLSLLIEGDLIEYVKDEYDMEKQNASKWALYMGNSKIMRFETKTKIIKYESYWKIAKNYYVFINKDLDKRLITLPIYETLAKARKAYENPKKYSKMFSSDKNFCTWCRFDINKSDVDFATDFKEGSRFSNTEAKEFLLNKFLNNLELAEDN